MPHMCLMLACFVLLEYTEKSCRLASSPCYPRRSAPPRPWGRRGFVRGSRLKPHFQATGFGINGFRCFLGRLHWTVGLLMTLKLVCFLFRYKLDFLKNLRCGINSWGSKFRPDEVERWRFNSDPRCLPLCCFSWKPPPLQEGRLP